LVQDLEFSYAGRGPRVFLKRTYNADDSDEGAFGRSWTFNYEVELVEEPGGDVNIKRESGKIDFFNSLGGGTYSPPLWSHDVLAKNANGTWDLRVKRTRLTQHFDTSGRLTSITDRNGNAVTLQYDGNGRLQTVTDAVGRITTFFYGANGKINRVVDPAGREATYTYDANNNLVGTTDMVGNVVTYTYDQNSYMSSLVVPKGTYRIVNVPYTEVTFGLVVSSLTDPLGHTKSYSTPGSIIVEVLDANGNAWNHLVIGNGEGAEITDPLGNKTKFIFTSSGDRTAIIDAKGNVTSLVYDLPGNVTSLTDPLLNRVTLTYDSRDNLTSLKDPLLRTYQYIYDAKDNLTRVTDPKSGITNFAYDSFGQLTSLTDPRGNVTSFTYDSQGNLKTMMTPLGRLTSYNYDAIGRMTSVTTPKGDTINYSYDGIDRITRIDYPDGNTARYTYECCNLIRVSDRSGTLNFVYDNANRMNTYSDVFGKTIQYGYDNVGNLTSLSYPDGKLVTYGYNKANRLTSLTDWLANTVTYDYDSASNLISNRTSSGLATAYNYDKANRLIALANVKPNGSLLSYYKYTMDGLGNRKTIAAQEPLSPTFQFETVTSTYDPDNQITAATGKTFVHDNNGNLISETEGTNVKTYGYDLNDRLVQAAGNGQTTQYQYDGLGHRLSKTVGGSVTRYVLDPNGTLSNVLGETDTTGNFTSYYVYGLGLVSKITPGGQTFFYEYDGLGSTVAIADPSGNVVNKYAYDPYGNLSSTFTETISNPFRYVGQFGVTDEENGLLYMRARYYASTTGRFLNRDPIGLAGGLNMYRYGANNPVRHIDPRGLAVLDGRTVKRLQGNVLVEIGEGLISIVVVGLGEALVALGSP
jgi:RHS repeat-associated protein